MGRRVVSFSLWGDEHRHVGGILVNAKMIPQFYPDWEMWVYTGTGIPDETMRQLRSFDVRLIEMPDDRGFFWRFYPASLPDVEFVVSRDADSRPSALERRMVDEWLDSGLDAHAMHCHPCHTAIFMGGMCGFRSRAVLDMKDLIEEWLRHRPPIRVSDQVFLEEVIYPRVRKSLLIHATADCPPGMRGCDGPQFRLFSCEGEDVPGGFIGAVMPGDWGKELLTP
jgi:hypothetical protein